MKKQPLFCPLSPHSQVNVPNIHLLYSVLIEWKLCVYGERCITSFGCSVLSISTNIGELYGNFVEARGCCCFTWIAFWSHAKIQTSNILTIRNNQRKWDPSSIAFAVQHKLNAVGVSVEPSQHHLLTESYQMMCDKYYKSFHDNIFFSFISLYDRVAWNAMINEHVFLYKFICCFRVCGILSAFFLLSPFIQLKNTKCRSMLACFPFLCVLECV